MFLNQNFIRILRLPLARYMLSWKFSPSPCL